MSASCLAERTSFFPLRHLHCAPIWSIITIIISISRSGIYDRDTHIFSEFWNRIPQIGVNDIIDILIVAFLFYTVMRLIRSTSAARIARSILLLLVVTGLTEIFKLYTLNWILSKILEIGVIALVIMFQPELRRMLERFGGRFFSNLISSSGSASPEQQAIEATVAACEVMSKEKVGALLISSAACA